MQTILGKAFVFVIVCLSLVSLGVSVWAIVDKHDWNAERTAILREIDALQQARERQRDGLITLLYEIDKGNRQMPWDPETGATPVSVTKTKQQIRDIDAEILTLFSKQQDQTVQQQQFITELAKARDDFTKAVAEHKSLREQIKPENPNLKGYRELIADHRAAKEAAEAEQERIKPFVLNELVRVAKAKARLDELNARLKELQGAGSAAVGARRE